MAIQRTLLIGNGPNRTFKDDPRAQKPIKAASWHEVLAKLSEYAGVHIHGADHKPLTLVFDEILLKLGDAGKHTIELQKFVGHLLHVTRNYPLDCALYRATKNVLTTNYSLNHISGFTPGIAFLEKCGISEKQFSLFRNAEDINRRRLWYINGCSNMPSSINLGYRQYARYQAQIKTYLTSGAEFSKHRLEKSPLFRNEPVFDFDKGETPFSWVDLFLRDHIDVVGYGMDFTESIMWWLLTEKLYLKQRFPKKIGNFTYYQINIDGRYPTGAEADKLNMLGDMGAIVKAVDADTYLNGYLEIAERLKPGAKNRYQRELDRF